jgi:putative transposase
MKAEMPKFEVASHTRYFIRYHIVWIVKRRRLVLVGSKLVKRLVEILVEIGDSYEMPVVEVGSDGDHLHLFCQTLPRVSSARAVQKFKSISARMMRQEFPELKQQGLNKALWGTGYYVATVGYQTNEQAVRAYVRNQGKKSKSNYSQLALFE